MQKSPADAYEYQQQLSGIPLISEHVLVVKASNHLVMPNMDDAGRGVPRACQRYFVYSGDRVGPATSTTSLQPGETGNADHLRHGLRAGQVAEQCPVGTTTATKADIEY